MVKWNRTDDLLKPIVSLYQQIWNSNTDGTEQFNRHMDYEGFRGYVCLDEEEMPVGFAYGYTSLSGQYYRELLTSHLKSDLSNEWLANCFEFVELCVHPSVRQKGIGSLLHDSLLKDIPFDTTILTTQYSNLAARNLYVRKGWIVIDDSFFPNEKTKERYLILGKKLS